MEWLKEVVEPWEVLASRGGRDPSGVARSPPWPCTAWAESFAGSLPIRKVFCQELGTSAQPGGPQPPIGAHYLPGTVPRTSSGFSHHTQAARMQGCQLIPAAMGANQSQQPDISTELRVS